MNSLLKIKEIIELKGITKKYPGIVAVNNVDLIVESGEVHGIVGENGAGKSTLCNILTGIVTADEGKYLLNGEEVIFTHPSQAINKGIRMVYQERNLVQNLTGAQNICLGEEPGNLLINENEIKKRAKEIMESTGVDVRLDIPVSYLSPSWQQMIEILRSIIREPNILILDEPTSSLTEEDSKGLFNLIRKLKERGITIIYISHKLEEVLSLCDRITIMRDGKKILTKEASELDKITCIQCIANRDLKHMYPSVHTVAKDIPIMQIEDLSDVTGRVNNVSFYLRKQELLGIYGLIGSGRTEMAEIIFGLRPYKKGKILFDGKIIEQNTPTVDLINKGILMTPEDRRKKGLFSDICNLKQNISIAHFDYLTSGILGLIDLNAEKNKALEALKSVNTKYRDIEQSVDELSGGNKQKVLISRWLSRPNRKVIIFDEATQGIDVGTKYELYLLFRKLVEEEGLSIIFISSELEELLGICDRLIVFKDGTISGELSRDQFSQEKAVSLAL